MWDSTAQVSTVQWNIVNSNLANKTSRSFKLAPRSHNSRTYFHEKKTSLIQIPAAVPCLIQTQFRKKTCIVVVVNYPQEKQYKQAKDAPLSIFLLRQGHFMVSNTPRNPSFEWNEIGNNEKHKGSMTPSAP